MPRTATALAMSLADLHGMIRERRRALGKLERQRARWQKKLDKLERRIVALAGPGGARGGRRVGPGGRARNETSLVDAITGVLSRAGGAMNVGVIVEKVQAGGYRSNAANFRALVNQTLIKDRKRFKNAGRGMYELGTAAPPSGDAPRRRRGRKALAKK